MALVLRLTDAELWNGVGALWVPVLGWTEQAIKLLHVQQSPDDVMVGEGTEGVSEWARDV